MSSATTYDNNYQYEVIFGTEEVLFVVSREAIYRAAKHAIVYNCWGHIAIKPQTTTGWDPLSI